MRDEKGDRHINRQHQRSKPRHQSHDQQHGGEHFGKHDQQKARGMAHSQRIRKIRRFFAEGCQFPHAMIDQHGHPEPHS